MKITSIATGAAFFFAIAALGGACSSSVNTGRADAGNGGDAATDGAGGGDAGIDSTVTDTGTMADSTPSTDSSATGDAGGECAAYATAECSFVQECEPGLFQATYGSMTACISTTTTNCGNNVNLTSMGTTFTVAACTTSLTTAAAACMTNGPGPRGVPKVGACTITGPGTAGMPCGLDGQCASDSCTRTGTTCGVCTGSAAVGQPCGPGSMATCAIGLECGANDTCVTINAVGGTCDLGVTADCVEGADCVVAEGGTTGTCQASGAKAGVACSTTGVGAPKCYGNAGFFCASSGICQPITYGSSCGGTSDGGTTNDQCLGATCVAGNCLAPIASGQSCTVGVGSCAAGTVCSDSNGGATGTCSPLDPACGADAGPPPFSFQPTNVSLQTILQYASMAEDEDVTQDCSIPTSTTQPISDCFNSPIEAVTQEEGSTVNLVVVNSLKVESTASISATGPVPVVIVSLSTVTFVGGNLQANSENAGLDNGPGGAAGSGSNVMGGGHGGGAAASGTAEVGAGGAGYCGQGGLGGGGTVLAATYGNAIIRPLVGGSAGGGGVVGGGAGGGAVQIVAAQSIDLEMGSYITVGGAGGQGGGAGDQNAGGGGSGGSILIEAPSVTIAGALAANGGGGGGGELSTAGDGSPNSTPAAGGASSAPDGTAAGGNGAAGATLNGSPGQTDATSNSGGGGGGVGRIRVNSATAMATTTAAVISPALTTSCATQGDLRSIGAGP
jgi:hypothetical protein